MELDYRPKQIEFVVDEDTTNMPASLGTYKDADEAIKFIGGNLTTINQAITVNRHMDIVEKKQMRAEYNDILENRLPVIEKSHLTAANELNDAKAKEKTIAN